MAGIETSVRRGPGRALPYLALALLVAAPVAVFGVAQVDAGDFSLRGPAGPALAFSAGLLSFVSPCVLPIVPIYLTHISGASVRDGRLSADRRATFTHAVAFIIGLSVVFIALGASAGLLGSYLLRDNQRELQQVAGVMLVFMGVLLVPLYRRRSALTSAALLVALTATFVFLVELAELRGEQARALLVGGALLLAWARFAGYLKLSFFQRSLQFDPGRARGVGYTRSALVGGAFALGWTPCIGPILSSIFALAASTSASSADAWTGTYLLAFYSAGLSVPFLLTGLAVSDAASVFKRMNPYLGYIEVASGIVLIAVGTLLLTGRLTALNDYFTFAGFNQGL